MTVWRNSPAYLAARRLIRHRSAMLGAVIAVVMVVCAAGACWLAPYSYTVQFTEVDSQKPSSQHWLGLSPRYRDNLSLILYGGRVSIQVALAATLISVLIGAVIGAAAGYAGGWLDEILMRIAEVFYAFPGILLALVIAAVLQERSIATVSLALGLTGWTGLARLVRGQVLVTREEDYVSAARAMGATGFRTVFRHVLPNCMGPVIVASTLLMAGNILGEAGLGFLGISGAEPPHPSWGGMLNEARAYVLVPDMWWMAAFPGIAIALSVLGFNLLGDGLRDALDPRGTGAGDRASTGERVDRERAG
jgi:peptide/nickel transport system permease protein